MPTGTYHHVTDVLNYVSGLNPKSILDVGCGAGRWGFLFHDCLDYYNERFQKEKWRVSIDGVEINRGYKTSLHKEFYRQVFYEDIRRVAPNLKYYDLINMQDVLEHLPKSDGADLIHELLKHCGVFLLVQPVGKWPYSVDRAVKKYGNPHEAHISTWTNKELLTMGFEIHKSYSVYHPGDYSFVLQSRKSRRI